MINFFRPRENSVFAVHDINSVNLLPHLKLDFSHRNKHKLRHDVNDIINTMC